MYSPRQTPPVPPPKPSNSNDPSRISTPASNSPRPPPQLPSEASGGIPSASRIQQPQQIPDPGPQWLPRYLQDKAKNDLAALVQDPQLLAALVHSPQTIHPSLAASHQALQTALAENIALASHLLELEDRVVSARAATSAQLLSARALERQWRAKQGEMDAALAPFAPASLYQRLVAGVAEQEGVCRALEESFLAGEGAGDGKVAGEREVGEWVRNYREAKRLAYLRRERKERWDEGRVGGWR